MKLHIYLLYRVYILLQQLHFWLFTVCFNMLCQEIPTWQIRDTTLDTTTSFYQIHIITKCVLFYWQTLNVVWIESLESIRLTDFLHLCQQAMSKKTLISNYTMLFLSSSEKRNFTCTPDWYQKSTKWVLNWAAIHVSDLHGVY